jgi:hypothetical protein
VWRSRSGARSPVARDDVELLPGRADMLRRHAAEGFGLFGLVWRPELAEAGTAEAFDGCAAALRDALALPLAVSRCPHAGGPPACWCRKPLPGLGVELMLRHRLDAARSVVVGASQLDRTFAERLGFGYRDAAELFGPGA